MKRLLLLAALAASPALGQQAVVSSSVKTFDNGTTAPAQADINGNLKVAIAATGASSTQVQGTTASGGTPADNPVPAGCTAATAQNATTAGQRSNVLCSSEIGRAHV